jgi:hypothetical protein
MTTILGTLDMRDFDLGCMLTIGASVVYYTIPSEGTRAVYVLDIPLINSEIERFGNKVPVFFDNPSDPYQDYIIPSVVFRKSSFNDAFSRASYTGTVGRAPAPGARQVIVNGVTGYTAYETQLRGDPFDIIYDMTVYARRQQELTIMVGKMLRTFRAPWFSFLVKDSIGDTRAYDAGDISYSPNSELADIADRTMTWTISFTVRAEIDTYDDVCSPSMVDPRVRFSTI